MCEREAHALPLFNFMQTRYTSFCLLLLLNMVFFFSFFFGALRIKGTNAYKRKEFLIYRYLREQANKPQNLCSSVNIMREIHRSLQIYVYFSILLGEFAKNADFHAE